MAKNSNLHKAKDSKKDEFYTQLSDIERELKHYRHHFKGKIVYCNCDDPRISNFFHYFSHKFEQLELKKLITTCYKNQERDLFSQNNSERAIYLEYDGDKSGNNLPDPEEIGIHHLKGDGDFRSPEAIALLKKADIVVTNPPFSLFREYVAQLIEYDKKFVIIGNQNAITYKEIFQFIKENKLWLGYMHPEKFVVPDDYEQREYRSWRDENGVNWRSLGNACWFTNLDISKRHEDIILYKEYNEKEYPEYDYYNAINVNKVAEIPKDYAGAMGVPITFLDKYNPGQFEIVNANDYRKSDGVPFKAHGLIKDKEALITTYKDENAGNAVFVEREREREKNNLCTNLHQAYYSHPDLTDGTSTENEHTPAYLSAGYLDMVARPSINGVKIYRRIFVKNKRL